MSKSFARSQKGALRLGQLSVLDFLISYPPWLSLPADRWVRVASRPGILVLINDTDWELEGEEKYELQPNDNVMFVSTLHGG